MNRRNFSLLSALTVLISISTSFAITYSANEQLLSNVANRFESIQKPQDDAPIKPPTDAVEVKPILPDPVKVKDGNKEETPQKLVAKQVKKTLIYGGAFAGATGLMVGLGAGLGIKALLITGAVLGGAGLIVGIALVIGLLIGYGKAVEKMLG